jgi:transposase
MVAGRRYFGMDVHKRHITVAAMDGEQEIVVKPRTIQAERFWEWARKHLRSTDVVAIEASADTWYYYDELSGLAGEVAVANTAQMGRVGSRRVKTDKRDALALAKSLAAKMLPRVWVPPEHVRQLRSLTAHRRRLVRDRAAAKNRLHSILRRHHLQAPAGNPFCQKNEKWWLELDIPQVAQLRVRHELVHLQHLRQLLSETDAEIARLSASAQWVDEVVFLIQLPGIGLVSAMTVLGAIGTIERFESASKLVGYAGLGASVHASGDTHRTGKITKEGRRELRTGLIECAWAAVRHSPYWQTQYEKLSQRLGKPKAITVIARKLLVTIWHVLSKREVNRHGDIQRIARNFMTWATEHRLASSLDLPRLEFVRQQLVRLGLKQPIAQMRYGSRLYALVYPGEEVNGSELAV